MAFSFRLLCCCLEGTDLIYEGITTFVMLLFIVDAPFVEGTDLIYEGITTLGCHSVIQCP
jgi:hypothetical protein